MLPYKNRLTETPVMEYDARPTTDDQMDNKEFKAHVQQAVERATGKKIIISYVDLKTTEGGEADISEVPEALQRSMAAEVIERTIAELRAEEPAEAETPVEELTMTNLADELLQRERDTIEMFEVIKGGMLGTLDLLRLGRYSQAKTLMADFPWDALQREIDSRTEAMGKFRKMMEAIDRKLSGG